MDRQLHMDALILIPTLKIHFTFFCIPTDRQTDRPGSDGFRHPNLAGKKIYAVSVDPFQFLPQQCVAPPPNTKQDVGLCM